MPAAPQVSSARQPSPPLAVCDVQAVDPVSLIAHEKVVVTVDALKKLEELLA
jgi:large subunit ribosomal protein L4